MNPFSIAMYLLQNLPKLVDAVRTIMASDAAKTIEAAVTDLMHHVTPGGPAAPALSPEAPPLVNPTPIAPPDTQASTGGE